jgi:hypothetical protein
MMQGTHAPSETVLSPEAEATLCRIETQMGRIDELVEELRIRVAEL